MAADRLDIDEAELETAAMRTLLNTVIDAHLEAIQSEAADDGATSEATDDTPCEMEDEMEIEDEMDDDGNPRHPDPSAQPRKRARKASGETRSTKKPTVVRAKPTVARAKPTVALAKRTAAKATDEDVLTKLKSYVFKCGVRKVWKKELEGLDEAQSLAKVKGMLLELGVEGRPSLDKCRKVKERREYEEELRAMNPKLILETRLRGQRVAPAPPPQPAPRLNLSAFGDSESE